ncbi:membrane protein [Virgisporangium aliadipatigenens]|uniref:Membrane protein n=1 Tax=Virgisporangium aliadipatigenens TaxID=741659 RepID=A0A8J3YPI9_9ACTN|nr:DUF998 domain-containing protein [Virgisporangium aliadipatigenens]GIJ47438.1 membrane protein [Virgisporangium aliadipatigenens]
MPSWVLWSAASAPVLLIGGWTLAAVRQPAGFDSTVDTISALAALDARDRWIMTGALSGVGVCHLVTAAGLHPASPLGRAVLALGGAATLGVAAFPLPADGGSSAAHTATAAVAFGALGAWPLLSSRRHPGVARGDRPTVPWGVRPPVAVAAGVGLLALVGWFGSTLASGERVGLAERVAAGAQALWPLVVALSVRRAARG